MTTEAPVAPPDVASTPVADALAQLLADTYTLYVKTHGFHWNVGGRDFRSLHLMFEEQYEELAEAVDLIAERIRAIGPFALGSLGEMAGRSSVVDEVGPRDAMAMVRRLIEAHETVVRDARVALDAAEAASDPVTVDLVTGRMAVHEKTLWMLRETAA